MKSRIMRQAGLVARVGARRDVYRGFWGDGYAVSLVICSVFSDM